MPADRAAELPVVLLDRDHPPEIDAVMVDHRRGARRRPISARARPYADRAADRAAVLAAPARDASPASRRRLPAPAGRRSESIVRTGGFSAEFGLREALVAAVLGEASDRDHRRRHGHAAGRPPGRSACAACSIPDDVSVIAAPDTDLAALATPGITAVRWSGTDEGRMAVQLAAESPSAAIARGRRSG